MDNLRTDEQGELADQHGKIETRDPNVDQNVRLPALSEGRETNHPASDIKEDDEAALKQ